MKKLSNYICIIATSTLFLSNAKAEQQVQSMLSTNLNCQTITQGKEIKTTLSNAVIKAFVLIRESPFPIFKTENHSVIWVAPMVDNLLDEPISIAVTVAFFDKSDTLLIALTQPEYDIEPRGRNFFFQPDSGFQRIPSWCFPKIHSCKVTILTTEACDDP